MSGCNGINVQQRSVNFFHHGVISSADVTSVAFNPSELDVVDINARRAYLRKKGFSGKAMERRLKGIFADPLGGRADEVLAMPNFAAACIVTSGMYFRSVMAEDTEIGRQTDAFLFFKSGRPRGRVISPINTNYVSGGFLIFGRDGTSTLVRQSDFGYKATSGQVCREAKQKDCDDIQNYRLIVQSNIVLVATDVKGMPAIDKGLDDNTTFPRSALAVKADGKASIIISATPITLGTFAGLLLKMGIKMAINLDGGPSVQLAQRTKRGIKKVVGWDRGQFPSQMPSLFIIRGR